MVDLSIDVEGVRVERYAAVPTLAWSLRLNERTGARVHAVALRVQVRIEPRRRRYDGAEQDGLVSLFGLPEQWGESLHPFLWTHLAAVLPGFEGESVVDLQMPCTYDLDVAASRYFHSLSGGEVPVVMLFSGTVFSRGDTGFVAEPVPWHLEARYGLPVATWQELIEQYFPGTGWLRLERATIDRLERYRSASALTTFDEALHALFKATGEDG